MVDSTTSRPLIVAVFGGNAVTEVVAQTARLIAGHAAQQGAIILSGGDGQGVKGKCVTGKNVKDEANSVARAHGQWISVLNNTKRKSASKGTKTPPVCTVESQGVVVRPEIGNRRNLLEAWMSDACVVLADGAGDGTLSELICALCLGRPTLLISDSPVLPDESPWASVRDWFMTRKVDEGASGQVIDLVRGNLGDVTGPMVDLVQTTIRTENLRIGGESSIVGSSEIKKSAEWIDGQVNRPGTFPVIRGISVDERGTFEVVKADYERWLASAVHD